MTNLCHAAIIFHPPLPLPSYPQSIISCWPVPKYTACYLHSQVLFVPSLCSLFSVYVLCFVPVYSPYFLCVLYSLCVLCSLSLCSLFPLYAEAFIPHDKTDSFDYSAHGWRKFHGRWTVALEQSSSRTVSAQCKPWTISAITLKKLVSLMIRLRHIVTFCHINSVTYFRTI